MLSVHHLAITVIDMSESKKFYEALLGHFDYTLHFSNDDISVIVPPKNSSMPEFLLYASKEKQKQNIHATYDPWIHHYCFKVSTKEQINDIFQTTLSFWVEILDAPQNYPNYAKNTGGWEYYALYFNDPNNIKLEFTYISE